MCRCHWEGLWRTPLLSQASHCSCWSCWWRFYMGCGCLSHCSHGAFSTVCCLSIHYWITSLTSQWLDRYIWAVEESNGSYEGKCGFINFWMSKHKVQISCGSAGSFTPAQISCLLSWFSPCILCLCLPDLAFLCRLHFLHIVSELHVLPVVIHARSNLYCWGSFSCRSLSTHGRSARLCSHFPQNEPPEQIIPPNVVTPCKKSLTDLSNCFRFVVNCWFTE